MKKSIIKVIIGLVFVGGIVAVANTENSVNLETHNNLVKELEIIKQEKIDLEESLSQNKEIIQELNEKLLEAEPFFVLQNEEKMEIEREAKDKEEARLKEEEEQRAVEEQAMIEASKIELTNGNYTSGVDFPEGTYDVVAIEGGGNVSTSNIFNGGLNAIMGVANDGFYEKEYKNIKLPAGTEISVNRVTINLIPR